MSHKNTDRADWSNVMVGLSVNETYLLIYAEKKDTVKNDAEVWIKMQIKVSMSTWKIKHVHCIQWKTCGNSVNECDERALKFPHFLSLLLLLFVFHHLNGLVHLFHKTTKWWSLLFSFCSFYYENNGLFTSRMQIAKV